MTTRILAAFTLAFCLAAQAGPFQPKHLAVLQAGNGELDLKLKQSPVFIDEFAPGAFNPQPLSAVAIPTNGPDTIFFNGHAATEGMLSRSADGRFLVFAGYGGVNLLQSGGTPSLLDIGRAFCTVDAEGRVHTVIYGKQGRSGKMNPRGAASDGENNFWSCGNALGTAYYNAAGSAAPVNFHDVPNSRAIKIINHTLYVTLNGADSIVAGQPPGIYSFTEDDEDAPLPRSPDSALKLVVPAKEPYTKIAGFDLNPAGTIAYVADTADGVQKYVKTNGAWNFAYNFSIPQNIPASENHEAGCFGLVVDFTGPAPIIYATTAEGYNGCANSNRVVQIVDTNANAVVTTLAQAPNKQVAYRGIDFTPVAAAKP